MTLSQHIEVRLARSRQEVEAAQRLRYRVFYDEWGATPDPAARESERDADAYDELMEHLVVLDHRRSEFQGQVVGTYRLLRGSGLAAGEAFYSSREFDIGHLIGSGHRLLELGRSCVLREYRSLPVLQLLWRAIAAYVAEHRIELMFGCASLRGTDPWAVREQLAFLHHFHLAPASIRPQARGPNRITMNAMENEQVDPARAMSLLEPMVKGYLRVGAMVGEGAYVDRQFNAIDVCIVMPTAQLARRYSRHFEHAIQRKLIEQEDDCRGDGIRPPRLVAHG